MVVIKALEIQNILSDSGNSFEVCSFEKEDNHPLKDTPEQCVRHNGSQRGAGESVSQDLVQFQLLLILNQIHLQLHFNTFINL